MSDEIKRIVDALPPADAVLMREHLEQLQEKGRQHAAVAIMMRNFSHPVGTHACVGAPPKKTE
jgi:hypothetical protein